VVAGPPHTPPILHFHACPPLHSTPTPTSTPTPPTPPVQASGLGGGWALGRRVASLARFLMDQCYKWVLARLLAWSSGGSGGSGAVGARAVGGSGGVEWRDMCHRKLLLRNVEGRGEGWW